MSQIDITKMSSKGQVVIPQELRKDIADGDKLVVIRNQDQIILKKANKFDKNLEEDLKFAKRTVCFYWKIVPIPMVQNIKAKWPALSEILRLGAWAVIKS